MSKTIDEVKAWITQGLLIVVGWFVVDLKNDVKILLDRTARLEERVQVIKETEHMPTANLIRYKGMDFVFDRNKTLTKTIQGYEYI